MDAVETGHLLIKSAPKRPAPEVAGRCSTSSRRTECTAPKRTVEQFSTSGGRVRVRIAVFLTSAKRRESDLNCWRDPANTTEKRLSVKRDSETDVQDLNSGIWERLSSSSSFDSTRRQKKRLNMKRAWLRDRCPGACNRKNREIEQFEWRCNSK